MNKIVYKIGFWSGLIAFTSTIAFTVAQTLQLLGVIRYPLDEILIYGFPSRPFYWRLRSG